MGKSSTIISKNPIKPGSIVFSPSQEVSKGMPTYSRLFRCRKKGFDFIGQIKINLQKISTDIEIFNTSYFDYFGTPLKETNLALENILLTKLLSEKNLPERLREAVFSLLKNKVANSKQPSSLKLINNRKVCLKEIFDKLNTEYFKPKIKANIEWGKKVHKKNLTSFRFGSYDPASQLIRIHPRLKQNFVPISVLELTVYHEMCHQWAPMKRQKGMWIAHHLQFKKKEREYRLYDEARSWEKENWKKLMEPNTIENTKNKTDACNESSESIEITTLAG